MPTTYTYLFFHAHPDDEALLTAGTMARLTAAGHRVVLVLATRGERGLTAEKDSEAEPLGTLREQEARTSAQALGCARLVFLGYADSGSGGRSVHLASSSPETFASADVESAAAVLARLLIEEDADLLTIYDPAGGYGHPDHVQVHRVGARAAELAGTHVVLQATVDRGMLLRAVRPFNWVAARLGKRPLDVLAHAFSPSEMITHRVDVRRYTRAKRASMAAHVSQTSGGKGLRTLALLLLLPMPLFRRALGTEWYALHAVNSRATGGDPLAPLTG